MAAKVSIRPAERRDAAELAILVDIASYGFASWIWYGAVLDKSADTAFERGRERIASDAVEDGWKNASLAEIDGAVAGAAIGRHMDETILEDRSPHPSLAPMVALQQQAVGNWFIDNLATYRAHRRKGVASRLLENEVNRAGDRPVSLIAAHYNTAALALYESFGFRRVAEREAYRTSQANEPHQWVLMTRIARD